MSGPSASEHPRMPARRQARRANAPRRRGLEMPAIVDAAMAIVDTQGLDALTMRGVAAALGTGAASLYAYVGSKDELIDLLIERAVTEMHFDDEPDPARWREQFRATAVAMREGWVRHGDLARASFARIPLGDNALMGAERLVAILRAGGLSDRVVGLAPDLIGLYVGAVAYEDSLEGKDFASPEALADYVREVQQRFENLPQDRFPHLSALSAAIMTSEDRFIFGLDVLLAGMEAIDRQGSAST